MKKLSKAFHSFRIMRGHKVRFSKNRSPFRVGRKIIGFETKVEGQIRVTRFPSTSLRFLRTVATLRTNGFAHKLPDDKSSDYERV